MPGFHRSRASQFGLYISPDICLGPERMIQLFHVSTERDFLRTPSIEPLVKFAMRCSARTMGELRPGQLDYRLP